jgi:predicted GNAT superfamily acetyltransferase
MTTPGVISMMDGMTDLRDVASGLARTAEAAAVADAAAARAGVRMRELTTLDDLVAVYRLCDEVWRPDPTNPPLTTELLRALVKAGSYVAGADDPRTGDLLGVCVGFFGAPADGALHSHIAAVSASTRGRGVGWALKLHQRAWALRHGVRTISWTFDPLVRRNAYFNIGKLAGTPTEYLTNFYGAMRDAINGGQESDRLLVRWDLGGDAVVAACAGTPPAPVVSAASAGIALGVTETGGPVAVVSDAATVLVAVPADVEALRITDPALARDWRIATRDVLGGLLADGARIHGFDRNGNYVVRKGRTGAIDRG